MSGHLAWHATAGDIWGHLVGFDMVSTEVAVSDIENALKVSGIPKEYFKDMRPTTIFNRAVQHHKKNHAIETVRNEPDEDDVIFQFTNRYLAAERLEYDYRAQLTLNKISGDITGDEPALVAEATKLFNVKKQLRSTGDITKIVKDVFKSEAEIYPIIPRKGVMYYVPKKHFGLLDKTEKFMNELGGRLARFNIPKNSKAETVTLQIAVMQAMEEDLRKLEELAESFDGSTRQSTINKFTDAWRDQLFKVESQAELLGDGPLRDKIYQEANRVKQILVAKVSELPERESDLTNQPDAEPPK